MWSPEHLLVTAAFACLKTTFDAYARREQLAVVDWRGTGSATLVKASGGPAFSSIDLDVEMTTQPGDEARAQSTLAAAERSCIISRALAVPVHVTSRVVSAPMQVAR
ncbi:MAG TPA: OsmC family protein [Kofleriaceae bacterium]